MFIIGMLTYFDPIITTELLSSLSFLFVPHKIDEIFVYHYNGNGDDNGKFICDIIERMTFPKVGRFSDLKEAVKAVAKHPHVTLKNNVTIIDEINVVDESAFAWLYNCAPVSIPVPDSFQLEMLYKQPLLYCATNSIITFEFEYTDIFSVKRFHVMQLKGQRNHVNAKVSFECPNCLLEMLTNKQVYNGVNDLTWSELINAISFLSYQTYLLKRDDALCPTINRDNVHTKKYHDQMCKRTKIRNSNS
ncbi:unnamed protein product [Xylocopa violacea]|uniref:Uncharacterized protein n=1 Tax=Xylocopa violacea TaxID=135666 RepID=A0ABP1MWS6_XYLVO